MKLLLSAYACQPNSGSEPGVGWRWSIELARLGHEVHVLTRANNREAIESERLRSTLAARLHHHYFDLPPWLARWKRGLGLYPYYYLWQWGAARSAQRLHALERFELVHHLTFGSIWQPTFMGRLGVPLVLGPLGGGEVAPMQLRKGYSIRGKVVDALRDVARMAAMADPNVRRSHSQARLIALRTPDNVILVAPRQRSKIVNAPDIGAEPAREMPMRASDPHILKLLYVGRLLHWKGLHLALRAIADLAGGGIDVRLTLVGQGPEEAHLRALAVRLGIADRLRWVGWVPHEEIGQHYENNDLFLFPSLHDSGGTVVLEAMSHGLPVICLDLGGPGVLISERAGVKVDPSGLSEAEVAARLTAAMAALHRDRVRLAELAQTALLEASRRTWSATVATLYDSNGLRV